MGFLGKGKIAPLALIFALSLTACGVPTLADRERTWNEEAERTASRNTESYESTGRTSRTGAVNAEKAPLVSERVTEADTEIFSGESMETERVGAVSTGRYVYSTLSAEARTVYDEILSCVLNQDTKITVSTLDKELLDTVYEAMNADYGGLFWLNGYVYTTYTLGGEITQLEFAPKYTMDYEERVAMQRSIDTSVEQMLSGISLTDSDYDKAKYVFETLISQVDYDILAPENQNIVSAFVYRRTVCQGYACATQYLLQQLGIESFIVTGKANNENHAWNILKLDGDYYYLDTTWGNSQYSAADQASGKFTNYAYLNVTTDEISRTHIADVPFELPDCTHTEDNYFVKEGLFFEYFEPDAVGELISTAWFSGPVSVSVKFQNAELLDQAINYFVTEQHIADFCPKLSNYSYLRDVSQCVLTVSF